MENTKKSTGQKVLNIVTTVLVTITVLAVILLMGARVIGLQVYTIVSGSMEPTYSVGDLIYVKPVEIEEIPTKVKVGEPVTFILNEDLVVATHRVTEIDVENKIVKTKGDANSIQDLKPVHFENVIGTPVFSIPYLGYVSQWIQSPPGLYIAIAVGVALLGLVFIPDLFRGAKNDELKKKEEELNSLREELAKKQQELSVTSSDEETEDDEKTDDDT